MFKSKLSSFLYVYMYAYSHCNRKSNDVVFEVSYLDEEKNRVYIKRTHFTAESCKHFRHIIRHRDETRPGRKYNCIVFFLNNNL